MQLKRLLAIGSFATLWREGNLLVDTTVYTLKQRYPTRRIL